MNKMSLFFAALIGFASYSGLIYSADTLVDSAANVEFPAQISFEAGGTHYTLEGTGTATRKKFFVKVYSVAHYLQDPVKGSAADVLKEVFDESKAKQLTLHWLRAIDAEKIHGAFAESFEKTSTQSDRDALKADIDKFLGFFSREVKSGDLTEIRWIPGGTIEVVFDGTVIGDVKNPAFAKAVWNIWLGPNSVVSKDRLIEKFVQ